MALLSIFLLGTPEFHLHGAPLRAIESDKTRALLAYLAVHAGAPHRRESLTALLWPDAPTEQARHNLRQALHNLRHALGDHHAAAPHIVANRQEVQFGLANHFWLDVQQFFALLRLPDEPCAEEERMARMRRAAQLYRDEFLKGFSLPAAEPFEEWRLLMQEDLHCRMMDALAELAAYHERRREYGEARRCLQRQLAFEPWREEAHCGVMRLFWLDGHLAAALHQYEKCRSALHRELAAAPDIETDELYALIRAHPHPAPECNPLLAAGCAT